MGWMYPKSVGKNEQRITGLGVMIEGDEILHTLGMVTLETWSFVDWHLYTSS